MIDTGSRSHSATTIATDWVHKQIADLDRETASWHSRLDEMNSDGWYRYHITSTEKSMTTINAVIQDLVEHGLDPRSTALPSDYTEE